jgi:transcriptional regulator with XRE-family HTH domain
VTADNAPPSDFAIGLGRRLRAIRQSLGKSLHDVETESGGLWPRSVTGSYERGSRNMPVGRLKDLCDWYGVAVRDVLDPPPVSPLVTASFAAITAALASKDAEIAELGARYEAVLADLSPALPEAGAA